MTSPDNTQNAQELVAKMRKIIGDPQEWWEPSRATRLLDVATELSERLNPSDTQNDTSELRQHLYDLFGQNFLDGDKPSEWKATTMNASEVKEFIDEFVVPLIAQREQAAEKKLWIARSDVAYLLGMLRELGYPHEALERTYGHGQATKPEKEG